MKPPRLLLLALLILGFAPVAAFAGLKQIAYPTADDASFIISVPSTWELTQAEQAGDFFHLDGPTGALFSFRTIEGTNESLESAIKESIQEINKQFDDVKLGEAEDWTPGGLSGFYATGQGTDKDGKPVRIGMGWCALKDGQIVELWFVTDLSDAPGMEEASAIANSLKSP